MPKGTDCHLRDHTALWKITLYLASRFVLSSFLSPPVGVKAPNCHEPRGHWPLTTTTRAGKQMLPEPGSSWEPAPVTIVTAASRIPKYAGKPRLDFRPTETVRWSVVVQSLSHVWLFATPWTAAGQASLSITISRSLLRLTSIEAVILSNHLILFFSCLQSFPASGSFPMSQLFTSGGQSMLESQYQTLRWIFRTDPLGWTGWISLQSKGLSRVFSNTTVQKHQFSGAQPSLWSNSHIHTWLLENHSLNKCYFKLLSLGNKNQIYHRNSHSFYSEQQLLINGLQVWFSWRKRYAPPERFLLLRRAICALSHTWC